jgi:hypothetical protein
VFFQSLASLITIQPFSQIIKACQNPCPAVLVIIPDVLPFIPPMTPKRALAVLAAFVIGALSSCASTEECGTCSGDGDCRSGFFCSTFSDGTRRCASGMGDTTCGKK